MHFNGTDMYNKTMRIWPSEILEKRPIFFFKSIVWMIIILLLSYQLIYR